MTAGAQRHAVADGDANVLLIRVGQLKVSTVEHDDGELHAVLRNGDHLGLKLQ